MSDRLPVTEVEPGLELIQMPDGRYIAFTTVGYLNVLADQDRDGLTEAFQRVARVNDVTLEGEASDFDVASLSGEHQVDQQYNAYLI